MSLTRPLGRRSGSTGFTLVELLVVISITALLVALLLPALGKAKAAAQMSVCASNLRNITVATQLYASDWRQYGPVGLPADQSEYARWPKQLASYLGQDPQGVSLNFNHANWGPKVLKVLQCPSTFGKYSVWGHNSYGSNLYTSTQEYPAAAFKGYEWPVRLTDPRAARNYTSFMLYAESFATGQIITRWSGNRNLYDYLHMRTLGYALADGHVEHRRPADAWYFLTGANLSAWANKNGSELWGRVNNAGFGDADW